VVASRILLLFFLALSLGPWPASAAASERNAARAFERIRDDPVALRQFLYRFPKGGELHSHLAGAIYAENYIAWAAADGKCIDLTSYVIGFPPCNADHQRPAVSTIQYERRYVDRIIDAFSTRNYERGTLSGHNQFFATFARFLAARYGREGYMLAAVTERAARQNVGYLELMPSSGMGDAREAASTSIDFDQLQPISKLLRHPAIDEIVAATIAKTDAMERQWRDVLHCDHSNQVAGCDVRVNYLAQVIRVFSREEVLAQTALAVRLMADDPRYVGLNFVAPEDHPVSLRDYHWQMKIIGELAGTLPPQQNNVSLHAGELALGLVPPEHLGTHIREAIEIAGAKRIGHGTDIVYDPEMESLLATMATSGIGVEISLTSSAIILGIAGDRHPFDTYRANGVPLTLSTDDEGVSRIDLTHEYQLAVETYNLAYKDIKALARNALELSFIGGKSLFAEIDAGRLTEPCRKESPGDNKTSVGCAAYLAANEKAQMQWALEERFRAFEARFSRR